jgi:hypothetical protein
MIKRNRDFTEDPIRDPYDIRVDSGEIVNIKNANPYRTLVIGGHKFRVKDIPITVATLDNGEIVRGVAFAPGNLVYTTDKNTGELISARVVKVQK